MLSWKEEDVLTGFLFIALICHGMFFAREWLILGTAFIAAFSFYRLKEYWEFKDYGQGEETNESAERKECLVELGEGKGKEARAWLKPVIFFGLMIILSLAGLLQPVRRVEGYLEAFRWVTFLIAYLWGLKLCTKPELREIFLRRALGIALLTVILTWLPGSELIWAMPGPPAQGRFALSFGYPNAAAAFLGCLFILLLAGKEINFIFLLVFGVSFVSTGSRAAMALLLCFSVSLALKRMILKFKERALNPDQQRLLGFYKRAAWTHRSREEGAKGILLGKVLVLIILLLFMQQTTWRWQSAIQHLLTWTDTSLAERLLYYFDSLKIAWQAQFRPQAGGWLAFPFVQTAAYWTLDPHSSLCRILLNQGLLGAVLVIIWAGKGLWGYLKDLLSSTDLTALGLKTAVAYLGLHSLVDADLSFGFLGILFWLLAGMIR
ncbi:MAG: hypothetical protein ACOX3R_14965 [Desulfitobacteriia bacterium]